MSVRVPATGSGRDPVSTLDRQRILGRLAITEPYYALRNERTVDGHFIAEAVATLPQGYAVGPMRPGDLSRHGAIAGACALALGQNDDKSRYYLARDAEFRGFLVPAGYGSPVRFEAEAVELHKREGRTLTRAYQGEALVATLEVGYTILTARAFERLNRAYLQYVPEGVELTTMPYPDPVRDGEDILRRRIDPIPAEVCRGHFDNYPAAPVAMLMDQLAQLGELFLMRPSYISYGKVTASELCWAGTAVTFTMNRSGDRSGSHRYRGAITRDDDRVVGTMQLELTEP